MRGFFDRLEVIRLSTQVASAHLDVTATTGRARQAVQDLVKQTQTQLATLTGVKVDVAVRLKAPSKAEVSAALSGIKAEKTVSIKIDSADAATRIGQIRTLLTNLGTTVSGLFNVNTAGFGAILSGGTAMITQFQAVVAELKRVLAEIRNTRPPNGPPAGAGGSGGGGANLNPYAAQLKALQGDLKNGTISTAQFETATRALKTQIEAEITSLRNLGVMTADQQRKFDALRAAAGTVAQALGRVGTSAGAGIQQLGRELGTAQSQYDRGAISLRTYLREMERIRTAGAALATGLQAGSVEARNLERVMGGLSTAARNINSSSITKIRTDMASARAEFERATVAAGRFSEKRAALQAYEASMRALEQRIQAVGQRSNISEKQMRALAQATQQLASQRGALQGIFTPLGLSGGVLNALKSLPQFAMMAGGSLGAAAGQASAFAGGLGSVAASAGPVGIAIAAVTVTLGAFAVAAGVAVNAYATFQDNLQNAKATLGLYGEAGKTLGRELGNLAQSPALTKLGFDSNAAAKAIEELGSRGLSTSEILGGGLETAAKLAAASGVKDLNVASEILVGTMRAFGLEGADAAKVPDLLANAANVSALRLEDFRLAIAAGGSAARTAGIDVTEFTATMSLMRDRLIGASDAGTSFKAFTAAFTANSIPAQTAMDKIGFSAFDSAGKMKDLRDIVVQLSAGLEGYTDKQKLATLETIFGSDGVRTATTLLDAYNTTNEKGTRLLDERTEALNQQGTADLAATERTDSLRAAQAELSNKVLLLKQRLGEELAPAVTKALNALARFFDEVIVPGTDKLIKFIDQLEKVKSPGELKATLQITAADDTTTAILKFMTGSVVGTKDLAVRQNPIVRGVVEVVRRNEASNLQERLQQNKLIETPGNPVASIRQFNQILGDIQKYRDLLKTVLPTPAQIQSGQQAIQAVGTVGMNLPQPAGAVSGYGLMVAQQTLIATGNEQADRVVDFCARWVRMTLGQAEPKISAYVNDLFQRDSNGDGDVTASDAARNAQKAGLLRQYTAQSDLKPGDTVFYQDGGAGHVGIYIGKQNGVDMVRGNNRLSNNATGNPVGNQPLSRLGTVQGFVRADDLYSAAMGGRVAPNVGPAVNVPGSPAASAAATEAAAKANAEIAKLVKQAQHLYNQQQLALESGNQVWLSKINDDVAVFKKAHASVWSAITQTNEDGAANATKAAQVTDAQYAKYQKRAKELAALEASTKGKGAASAAAGREIAGFVKNNPVAAKVLDYERQALKKREQKAKEAKALAKKSSDEQTAIAREAAQGQVEAARSGLERLKTIQTRALVNAGEDVTARAKIARDGANAIAGAEKKIADAQLKLDQNAANALAPANRQGALDQAQTDYANRLREIETDRLRAIKESGKTIQEEQAKLDQQLQEGRVADARLTLDRIAGLNERELIRFKGTSEQRIKIVARQAGLEAAAKLKVAEAQKKLDDTAAKALPVGQQAAALARSKTTFENAQRDIENARLRVVRESNEALKVEQQQFDAQVREGRVEQARLTLERIQQLNEQELQRFAGTAAQREVIIRRQADAELAAKKQIALAQKKIDDAAALALAPGLQAGATKRAQTAYDNAVRAAQIQRDSTVQGAKAATKEEVDQAAARQKAAQALERDLRQLNERFAQQVNVGNVTADSVLRYKQSLEDLRAKASELPAALQANIKGLLTQGATLGTQGQGIANYRTEIDKLKDAVNGWAYAELEAARARVIANGGDPKKLAILDAEIAKRKTLTGVQLQQLQAENQVAEARIGTNTLEGQLTNAQDQAKGNLSTLYSLELEYGGKIQAARDAQARTEADDEIRQVNEKYKKLGELEGLSRKDRLELAAAQGKALADIETRLGITVAKNASDRSAAELNAKTALDAALLTADRTTRDTIRKNALDLLARQTADLEAAQAEELSAEGLTQAQILDIRKKYQPLLVEQKKKEVAASREIEAQAENDRYADAVDAARQNGTLQTVAAKLLEEHTSNLGAIERRGTDAVRDYELSTKRDVGQAILAADKATSEELVKTGQERIDRELEGLSDMTEAQRQLALQTLEFWREVYTAQGAVGKAALADVDAAIAKIGAAGRKARQQAGEAVIDNPNFASDFARDLKAIGKDEDASDAQASAEAKYSGLLETYRGYLKKSEEAARQYENLSDDALTGDERAKRDALLAQIVLLDDFIAQIVAKSGEAGTKAAAAFTQAEADKTEEARLALTEAEYARAQQAGTDGSAAYREGLNTALAYWRARKEGLKTNSPEYLAALQKVTELEGKLGAVSPEKIKDQEQAASQALLEARYALAQAEGKDGSPAYIAGLQASLAYWRGRLEGLKNDAPAYLAALQTITDLEGKIGAAQADTPLVNRLKGLAGVVGKNGTFQKTVTAGLDGLAAYFGAGGSKGGRKAILAGAEALVGGLGEVFKTGNEETDQVISTFVSGVQGTLSALAKGDWIGAIIAGVATVVSTIIDIFQGGKKSMQKAKAEIEEATKGIKFFDVSKYAKVESQGGFWGWLGFKKSVIDEESVEMARTLGDALYNAISGGMLDGIKAGKTSFASLNLDLKKSLAESILQGLIDGFIQGSIMKDLIQPFLDQYIAARKTADPTDDVKAATDLQAAIVTGNNELAQFYEGVLVPTAQQLGVFGTDGQSSAPLGGNAVSDLGLVSAPAAASAAPAWAMEFTGASIGLTKAFNEVIPVLNRIATDGFSVDAQAQVILQNAPSDLRAYATR